MAELNYSKKRLEPIVNKFGIDVENDKVFLAIVALFPNQTDYQMWALKVVFSKVVTLDNIIRIKEWADENPTEISHLSKKNLVSYKTAVDFASLFNEMENLSAVLFVRSVISKFNTNQRKLLTDYILNPIAKTPFMAFSSARFSEFHKLFTGFETLPTHRKQKFISLMSAVDSITAIKKHLMSSLEESYDWNREDMLSFAKRNCPDTEVCFDENNVVVLRVPSFNSSKKLCGNGRTSWCLTREASYFRNYTESNNNAQQFFLFDFNKQEKHELAHVGFSVNPQKGINYAHTTRNNNLMGSQMIDGKGWNIHDVLKSHKISKNVYIRLKALVNYHWNKESFLELLSKHHHTLTQIDDNRFIVPIENSSAFSLILSHTLVPSTIIGGNNKTFAVVDFSKDLNDDKSILVFVFAKDKYEVLSFNSMYDAYGAKSTNAKNLGENNLASDMFVKIGDINPDILLHKLIDEQNVNAAIKLLSENENIDPNTEFYGSIPVIKAITSRNSDLFKALVNHKKFDMTLTEGFGEPYMQFVMLFMETLIDNKTADLTPFFNMVYTFIDNEKYNINAIDLNGDAAIHVACEMNELAPIVERLVQNPKCDVNIKNEWGFTPLDVALDNSPINSRAINALLSRKDLVIESSTMKFASEHGINLEQMRKNVQEVSPSKENSDTTTQEVDKYAAAFAKAFGK